MLYRRGGFISFPTHRRKTTASFIYRNEENKKNKRDTTSRKHNSRSNSCARPKINGRYVLLAHTDKKTKNWRSNFPPAESPPLTKTHKDEAPKAKKVPRPVCNPLAHEDTGKAFISCPEGTQKKETRNPKIEPRKQKHEKKKRHGLAPQPKSKARNDRLERGGGCLAAFTTGGN